MSDDSRDLGTATEVEDTNWSEALAESLAATSSDETPIESTPDETPEVSAAEDVTGDELEQESVEDALEPLERWPEEVKTRFQSLDKETQQFLLDREKDIESHLTTRTQELSNVQRKYERYDAVLQPYEEVARRQGLDLAPHLAQAMQIYSAYVSDPVSTLKSIVQANQLTAEQLGLVDSDEDVDPTIKGLRSELDQTRRELASLKQGFTQSSNTAGQQQIDAFANAKDDQGNPKHPHFEQVRHLMVPLVQQGKSLEDAYADAVWAVPEYREQHTKAERKKAEQELRKRAEEARKAKLKKAKEAETTTSTDTDTREQPGKFNNWADALQETLSQMQ